VNDRDYAVVVGINAYRNQRDFRDLEGPANDAKAFVTWLKSPEGGGLPAAHVDPYVRLSDPGRRAPTAGDLQDLLRTLFTQPREEDQPIGRRLYVFLAGHGFTNSVTLSLLHAVDTHRDVPAFVSGTQWLDCFHQSALFDELVLCMDCCRDFVPDLDIPSRPCKNRLDRAGLGVKRLYLLATGIGRGAYEQKFGEEVRGLFSYALINALVEDAIDGDGRLTAANVAECVRQALEPAAIAQKNIFPDPVCTHGFVLFENLRPRLTRVDIRLKDPGHMLEVFAGNDEALEHPIEPIGRENGVARFELPRGKTYSVYASTSAGRTVHRRELAVKNLPQAFEI
jgi:hypothetical protein